MKSEFRGAATVIFVCFCALLIVTDISVGLESVTTAAQIADLRDQVHLLRISAKGKPAIGITHWLGEPNLKYLASDGSGRTIFYYPSNPSRKNGKDDIAVFIDAHGRIESVYYADYSDERDSYVISRDSQYKDSSP